MEKNTAETIIIRGAKVNNLKNVSIDLPRNKMIVITGLSGSGKSSFAFDTLYAEGQRRYVESLSSYARQFMGKMTKPAVDLIKGIPPAIAIEQRVISRNARSTVGTATEIYEYLKLLFARVGHTYSPISGEEVTCSFVSDVVDAVKKLDEATRIMICFPLVLRHERNTAEELDVLTKQGFTRLWINNELHRIDEPKIDKQKNIAVLVDRLRVSSGEDFQNRLTDSVQTAFSEGEGKCLLLVNTAEDTWEVLPFSNRFEKDGIVFEDPTPNLFSFNSPIGACPECEGYGSVIGIDPDLVIPDKRLSVYEGAVVCWHGDKMSKWKDHVVMGASKCDFPIHKPIEDLNKEQYNMLWKGTPYFHGINDFFEWVETQQYKVQYRVMLSRYRGKTVCPTCEGSRLRKEALYVKVGGKNIAELCEMPVSDLKVFFENLQFQSAAETTIAKTLLTEVRNRLQFLEDVGLGYLTLNRPANTLSGGESQRINLSNALGSSLVGSIYILDEPSIGLHPRDTARLVQVLKHLRDIGNTVAVVEHEEAVIRSADYLVDFGPEAGSEGGQIVFAGTFDELISKGKGLTAQYFRKELSIPVPTQRRKWNDYIKLSNARAFNLKGFDVKIPLHVFIAVSGVSGSGKTTLVRQILVPNLQRAIEMKDAPTKGIQKISGDVHLLENVVFVDQNPIGRSSRSNPVTYVKAFDEIRQLYAEHPLSKARGYRAGTFSFNSAGGRCEACEGEGVIHIEMQFMADVDLLCDECHGQRFKEEVLEVRFEGKNIFEILDMTIDEAITFFQSVQQSKYTANILDKLLPLQAVGLGYLKMGQSSDTLSGGEAQRIKLASYLSKGNSNKPTLFIFDEPTTGLHFHDIHKLLRAFDLLLEKGHSVLVIEHNPDVLKCADWIIDLGPEGGELGGNIVCEGTPETIAKCPASYTGQVLKDFLH